MSGLGPDDYRLVERTDGTEQWGDSLPQIQASDDPDPLFPCLTVTYPLIHQLLAMKVSKILRTRGERP